jgi:hypothetical protein
MSLCVILTMLSTSYKWNQTFLRHFESLFETTLIPLSLMSSSFIYIVGFLRISFLFRLISHFMHVPHFDYPFVHQGIHGLLLLFCYCEYGYVDIFKTLLSNLWDIFSGVDWLNHLLIVLLISWGVATHYNFTTSIPIKIAQRVPTSWHSYQHWLFRDFF